jgi:FkbH-like protein/non-ribosomal peptide synthase protein (TIGR01720 family)
VLPSTAVMPRDKMSDFRAKLRELGIKIPAEPQSRPGSETGPSPLSFAQETQWVLHQLNPGGSQYNVPLILRLKGGIDHHSLEHCIREITRRHGILRTSFHLDSGPVVQRCHSNPAFEVRRLDVTRLPDPERAACVSRITAAAGRRPFDLTRAPLLRALVLTSSKTEHFILLTFHHIVMDGWSISILLDELRDLSREFHSGAPSLLPELPFQVIDAAAEERHIWTDEKLEHAIQYWEQKLSGAAPAIDLPLDVPRSHDASPMGAQQSIVLPQALSSSLQSFARKSAGGLFPVLVCALNILLAKWTGSADIVIGSVVANRNNSALERLIGCFLNFVPLRNAVTEEMTAHELLAQVRDTIYEALAQVHCPFDRIVSRLRPRRQQNMNPLYNVGFLLQNFPPIKRGREPWEIELVGEEVKTNLLDLRLIAQERSDGISLDCEYNASIFGSGTIVAFLDSFSEVLNQLLHDPARRLKSIQLTPALVAQAETAKRLETAVVVLSTFTADPIKPTLEYWFEQLQLPIQVYLGPHGQIFQTILADNQPWSRAGSAFMVLLLRLEDWVARECDDLDQLRENLRSNLDDLISAIRSRADQNSASFLIAVCPPSAATAAQADRAQAIRNIEADFLATVGQIPGVMICSRSDVFTLTSIEDALDPVADQLAAIPYTEPFFTALATVVTRKIFQLRTPPYKVIAVDCDDTLWDGACGENEPHQLQLGEARIQLQSFLRDLRERGILICLCSKNHPDDVWRVFQQRPDMPLRAVDIAASRINWEPKSQNLRDLADELNVGLDSFMFLDNNPAECAEVRSNCEGPLVWQLPDNPRHIGNFLNHLWTTDRRPVTAEDHRRQEFYLQQGERRQLERSLTLADFIERLDLRVALEPLTLSSIPRAAQMTERTNQFNTTGVRQSEADLQHWLRRPDCHAQILRVQDRFGDYGIVGLALFHFTEDTMAVESLLLSCRVLGKGVEHRFLNALAELARPRNTTGITIKYRPTGRNAPALKFLHECGAQAHDDESFQRFVITVEQAVAAKPLPPRPTIKHAHRAAHAPVSRSRLQVLERIPHEFNDAASIVRAVDAHFRRANRIDQRHYARPKSPVESTIAQLFQEVLNLDAPVGRDQDFFQLGGDSMSAVKFISRLKSNLAAALTMRQFYGCSTVSALAHLLPTLQIDTRSTPAQDALPSDDHSATNILLTPIQHWLFERKLKDPQRYNMAFLFELHAEFNPQALCQTVQSLRMHHEALRIRFDLGDGRLRQILSPIDELIPIINIDLQAVPEPGRTAVLSRTSGAIRTSFRLDNGNLFQVAVFRHSPSQPLKILFVLSHLITDGISLPILVEDFETIYNAAIHGAVTSLPAPTSSFRQWAARLQSHACSPSIEEQIPLWLEQPWQKARPLPIDNPCTLSGNTYASIRTADAALSKLATRRLLVATRTADHLSIESFLLASIAFSFARWSGSDAVVIERTGHGRDIPFEDIDLSRTVGYLTVNSPILLEPRPALAPLQQVVDVDRKIKLVPNGGIGFGVIRYLHPDPDIRRKFQSLPAPQIKFNYHGDVDALPRKLDGILRPCRQPIPEPLDPTNLRAFLFNIETVIHQGALRVTCKFSDSLHHRATVDCLLGDQLRFLELISSAS